MNQCCKDKVNKVFSRLQAFSCYVCHDKIKEVKNKTLGNEFQEGE